MVDGLRPPPTWSGRFDGPEPEHARWHTRVRPWQGETGGLVVVGFASDEGVRRNHGRPGAAEAPGALRDRLASLADPGPAVYDAGDVLVTDGDLEAAQQRLGAIVARILAADALPVVLGGGHEVAYGSYLGWQGRVGWGFFNVDAHFDLRVADQATSGTPFRQAADAELSRGRPFNYGVVGICRPSNTRALFDDANRLGVQYLRDHACTPEATQEFASDYLRRVETVHLSIDLDALPGAVAPGVSAPAAYGISIDAARAAVRRVAGSGKLGLIEVAEVNPPLDLDGRTARTAALLIDEAVRHWWDVRIGAVEPTY